MHRLWDRLCECMNCRCVDVMIVFASLLLYECVCGMCFLWALYTCILYAVGVLSFISICVCCCVYYVFLCPLRVLRKGVVYACLCEWVLSVLCMSSMSCVHCVSVYCVCNVLCVSVLCSICCVSVCTLCCMSLYVCVVYMPIGWASVLQVFCEDVYCMLCVSGVWVCVTWCMGGIVCTVCVVWVLSAWCLVNSC